MKQAILDDISPASGCTIVGGQGHSDPLVMVVAEAPGEEEERTGTPAIGKSGQLLRGQLSLSRIDPHAIYYTNAVKCRPHKNRTPTPDEIAQWLPLLYQEVSDRAPLHIILAGRVAERAWEMFSGSTAFPEITVHRIAHPAAVMRNRKTRGKWEEALRLIGMMVNGEIDTTEVVAREPDPWEEGIPDYDSTWLAADTEFRLLTDGGSDDGLVSVQVSDGIKAQFARFDDIPRVQERLRGTHVYAHNIKADAGHLGIDLDNFERWDDTGLIAYTLRYPRVGLKTIGPELTGIDMEPIGDMLTGYDVTDKVMRLTKRGLPRGSANVENIDNGDGTYTKRTRKKIKWQFDEALERDYERAKTYALKDAVVTSRVAQILVPQLRAEPKLWQHYQTVDKPIVPILDRMERRGVLIDTTALEPLAEKLQEAKQFHDSALREILGRDDSFNPASNDQLAEALLSMGLPLVETTKTGNISVGEDVLLRAVGEIDLEKIDESTDDEKRLAVIHTLRSREYAKLHKTYVERLINDRDDMGRIHASFNQMVADTNRFSSSGPNLQNIPARGNIGSAIRRAFVAAPGHVLVKTDFSALEVRIFAHYTQDEAIIWAISNGISPHDLNAERFGIDRGPVKNWYFAVIYGAEAITAALTAGVTIEQAWAMMRKVKEESPAILTWPMHIQNQLIEQGYIETLFGWRNYYPHFTSPIKSESMAALREAGNMPIQGTASGIVKKFMIGQDQIAREEDATLVLQVHDETVAEVPERNAHRFVARTVDFVRSMGTMGVDFSVPLDVEVKVGDSWADSTSVYKEGVWKVESYSRVYETGRVAA